MKKKNKREIIGRLITIVIFVAIVVFSNLYKEEAGLENIANIVIPIQNGLTFLKNKLKGNDSFFTEVSAIQDENEKLKVENENLQQQMLEFETVRTENKLLKEYLNLSENYIEYETKPGTVIVKDYNNFSSHIIINLGSREGMKAGMTVVSEKGLVGNIVSVTEKTAKIQTIIDPSSQVSATLSTTKDGVIVKGELSYFDRLKGQYLPADSIVMTGDTVETSGLGRNL